MAGPPELSGIATLKPAKRRDEVEFQIAAARAGSGSVVTLTYHPSRFDAARVKQVEIDGISDPVDSNGRENLVFFEPGDATKLLTVGLHMIVSITPSLVCEGHTSTIGSVDEYTDYCDGRCRS